MNTPSDNASPDGSEGWTTIKIKDAFTFVTARAAVDGEIRLTGRPGDVGLFRRDTLTQNDRRGVDWRWVRAAVLENEDSPPGLIAVWRPKTEGAAFNARWLVAVLSNPAWLAEAWRKSEQRGYAGIAVGMRWMADSEVMVAPVEAQADILRMLEQAEGVGQIADEQIAAARIMHQISDAVGLRLLNGKCDPKTAAGHILNVLRTSDDLPNDASKTAELPVRKP